MPRNGAATPVGSSRWRRRKILDIHTPQVSLQHAKEQGSHTGWQQPMEASQENYTPFKSFGWTFRKFSEFPKSGPIYPRKIFGSEFF
jgi:hypothetical protein